MAPIGHRDETDSYRRQGRGHGACVSRETFQLADLPTRPTWHALRMAHPRLGTRRAWLRPKPDSSQVFSLSSERAHDAVL